MALSIPPMSISPNYIDVTIVSFLTHNKVPLLKIVVIITLKYIFLPEICVFIAFIAHNLLRAAYLYHL